MTTLRKKFGRHLRYIRREKDLTQEQLAEIAKLSVDTISLIERGINAPSFETLEKFANALNVTVYELFQFAETE